MLLQLYRYVRVLYFLLVVQFLLTIYRGHLLVTLGTGAFVRLQILGP